MHVARCDDRLAELFAELDDLLVYRSDIVLAVDARDIVVVYKEFVISDRLDLELDVVIGDFRMPWETKDGHRPRPPFRNRYASSADTWATEPAGINQIGCIFSIQGLEVDYMGVIIGPDLDYDPATGALVAVPGKNMDVKTGDAEIYEKHIKNIYRVLLT